MFWNRQIEIHANEMAPKLLSSAKIFIHRLKYLYTQQNTSFNPSISHNTSFHRQKSVTAQYEQRRTGRKGFGRTGWFPTRSTATSAAHISPCSSKPCVTGRTSLASSLWSGMLICIKIISFLLRGLVGKTYVSILVIFTDIKMQKLLRFLMQNSLHRRDDYRLYWGRGRVKHRKKLHLK